MHDHRVGAYPAHRICTEPMSVTGDLGAEGRAYHAGRAAVRIESDGGDPILDMTVERGERLLHALVRAGKRAIPVGCRGGGCGVCRIAVISGTYERLIISRAHVTAEEAALGFALACRVLPQSNLVARLAPRLNVAFIDVSENDQR